MLLYFLHVFEYWLATESEHETLGMVIGIDQQGLQFFLQQTQARPTMAYLGP